MKQVYKLRGFVSLIVLVIIAALFLIFSFFSSNGGFSLWLPGGEAWHAKPPARKMISYMEDKYGCEFQQITNEEFFEDAEFSEDRFHSSPNRFANECNGIVVKTNNYPDHYFYVRSCFGEITDDYGCHLVQPEAEKIMHDKLSDAIKDEFKVACPPSIGQEEYAVSLTAQQYLQSCNYRLKIFINSDGDDKEQTSQRIINILKQEYEKGVINKRYVAIYYLNPEMYNNIVTTESKTYYTTHEKSLHYGDGIYIKEEGDRDSLAFKWDY
ncbi:MAG: hypothetical protein J6A37_01330 [Oscillospiraceae bacterium]|nr:hypothetical protein [Oscillospiraceae bacterium]